MSDQIQWSEYLLIYLIGGSESKMEQVIEEQVKKECDKICSCIYEETKGSIRVYPYKQIITSRLIVAIDMIKKNHAGMVDYFIDYDGLRREIYISVLINSFSFLDVWFNPVKEISPNGEMRK